MLVERREEMLKGTPWGGAGVGAEERGKEVPGVLVLEEPVGLAPVNRLPFGSADLAS